jgi:hypothetical protein
MAVVALILLVFSTRHQTGISAQIVIIGIFWLTSLVDSDTLSLPR